MLDAVLLGHEGQVMSLSWPGNQGFSVDNSHPRALFTASTDGTAAEWIFEDMSWTMRKRFGEVVEGSLGFSHVYIWSHPKTGHDANLNQVLVSRVGKSGAIRCWITSDEAEQVWKEVPGWSSHFGAVHGLAWNKDGHLLLSTRLNCFACMYWKNDDDLVWIKQRDYGPGISVQKLDFGVKFVAHKFMDMTFDVLQLGLMDFDLPVGLMKR